MPALVKARDQSKQIKCASNLRQIGQALVNYSVNNHGFLPTFSNWQVYGGDGTGEDEPGLGWCEMLEPYIGKPASGIYWCPGFAPETQFNYFMSVRWVGKSGRPWPCSLQFSEIKR